MAPPVTNTTTLMGAACIFSTTTSTSGSICCPLLAADALSPAAGCLPGRRWQGFRPSTVPDRAWAVCSALLQRPSRWQPITRRGEGSKSAPIAFSPPLCSAVWNARGARAEGFDAPLPAGTLAPRVGCSCMDGSSWRRITTVQFHPYHSQPVYEGPAVTVTSCPPQRCARWGGSRSRCTCKHRTSTRVTGVSLELQSGRQAACARAQAGVQANTEKECIIQSLTA